MPPDIPPLSVDTRDIRQCLAALAALPVTNVSLAYGMLTALLTNIRRHPPSVVDYLTILESAREPLAVIQDALAARYSAKPLPASIDESTAFEKALAMWRLMADSYAHVAQIGGREPGIQAQLALICQRCVHYAGCIVIEYYRAHRALAKGVWLDLHGYYDSAEDWGLAEHPVDEPLNDVVNVTTAQATYAAVLLVDLSNPYGRTSRELSWIIRWARTLGLDTKVYQPDDSAGSRGYGIDLMQDKGLRPVDQLATTPSARIFDTSLLAKNVHEIINRLKNKEPPVSLRLGNDCPAPMAARLLVQLYRPWCLVAMARRFQRNNASGVLTVTFHPESIYYHVVGRQFEQPVHARTYSRADVENIWSLRHQLDPNEPLNVQVSKNNANLNYWELADQSMNGFRAFRSPAGPRVEHGQLVALMAPGKSEFQLGQISWLMQETDGRLQAGIHVLPGPVSGVALRPTGVTVTANDPYVPGYLLPAVPSLKEPMSVIVPSGWFSPGKVIEVFSNRAMHAQLEEQIAKGIGFERCSFSMTMG